MGILTESWRACLGEAALVLNGAGGLTLGGLLACGVGTAGAWGVGFGNAATQVRRQGKGAPECQGKSRGKEKKMSSGQRYLTGSVLNITPVTTRSTVPRLDPSALQPLHPPLHRDPWYFLRQYVAKVRRERQVHFERQHIRIFITVWCGRARHKDRWGALRSHPYR
jgi:hypothetical protein